MARREIEPDALLTTAEFCAALRDRGIPFSPATAATKRCRGTSPPFVKFGPHVRYPWGPGWAWALAQLSPAVSSTAELDAQRAT